MKLHDVLTLPPIWPSELFGNIRKEWFFKFASNFHQSGFGLELRLTNDVKIDVSLLYQVNDNSLIKLAQSNSSGKLSPDILKHPLWSKILDFLNRCLNHRTEDWQAKISAIWLEFDALETTESIPIPGFFFNLGTNDCQIFLPSFLAECRYLGITIENTEALSKSILELITSFPDECYLRYVGLMLSRKDAGIRFCVSVPPDKLSAFLSASKINFPNNISSCFQLIAQLCKSTRFIVHTDLGGQVTDKVGIDIFFNPLSDVHKVFEELSQMGLCTPQKALAISKWCQPPHKIDINLSDFDHLPVSEINSFVFIHDVNHIKFVFSKSGEILGIKAYLWVGLHKIRRFSLKTPTKN